MNKRVATDNTLHHAMPPTSAQQMPQPSECEKTNNILH